MKNLLKITAFAFVIMLSSCSVEPVRELQTEVTSQNSSFQCFNGQAGARITNNGNIKVSLEIFDAQNNLIESVYDLTPGAASDWYYFQAGLTTFNLVSEDGKVKTPVLDMNACVAFDMEIGANNQLISDNLTQY